MTATIELKTKQEVLNHPTKWNDVASRRKFRQQLNQEQKQEVLSRVGVDDYTKSDSHLEFYDRYPEQKENERIAKGNFLLVGAIWFFGGWTGRNVIRGLSVMRRARKGWF